MIYEDVILFKKIYIYIGPRGCQASIYIYIYRHNNFLVIKSLVVVKGLGDKLASPNVQSAWRFRGEMI